MFHVSIASEHWLVVAAGASSSMRRRPGPCDSVTEPHTALALAIVEPCTSGEPPHTTGVFQEALVALIRPWTPPGVENRAPGAGWADRDGDPSSAVCQGRTSTRPCSEGSHLCSVRDVVCVPSLRPSFALSLAPLVGFWACCRAGIILVE